MNYGASLPFTSALQICQHARINPLTDIGRADNFNIMININMYGIGGILLFAACSAAASAAKSLDDIYSPTVVGVPPADAVYGLCKMPDGKIRYYNYGGQAENLMPGSHSEVSNRMYIESSDGGLTWSETQAPKGKEFGVFFDESRGR